MDALHTVMATTEAVHTLTCYHQLWQFSWLSGMGVCYRNEGPPWARSWALLSLARGSRQLVLPWLTYGRRSCGKNLSQLKALPSAYCNVCLFPRTISYFFNTLFCLCLIWVRRVQINQISQVHKMARIGSKLWRSSAPTPPLKQGHLEQDTQDHVKTVF